MPPRRSRRAGPWVHSEEGEFHMDGPEEENLKGMRSPMIANPAIPTLRHSFVGFLLGSTLAASGAYFYVLQDYKTSNALLTEDIYVRLCI